VIYNSTGKLCQNWTLCSFRMFDKLIALAIPEGPARVHKMRAPRQYRKATLLERFGQGLAWLPATAADAVEVQNPAPDA
jgi:hypothetical protein